MVKPVIICIRMAEAGNGEGVVIGMFFTGLLS
jgi:hypothetical protein